MTVNLLKKIEHELTCITGLYAADNLEFNESFQLDYNELIKMINEKIKELETQK
ncbi:hypothetical protein MBORA_15810 [Methanobrevibacter oralis]|uniref:Uncharacterized protein n=1 Tax=Methanobrevibacter oralis TaxID=66851 RepID=A0A165ZYM0_METOA|nr:hypothetical protein [Methanobrevibacter oralis]KZX11336.1 hypothetical protein MBORA_15810 [Methanobrevibacter oralis]